MESKNGKIKEKINTVKKSAFNDFVEQMDYRKDGHKAHNFISNVQKEPTTDKKTCYKQ
jgi:hypothetical protein